MRRLKAAALFCALTVALTACGNAELSSSDGVLSDEISTAEASSDFGADSSGDTDIYENSQLIKYPEYPETAIARDWDYYVRVIQGENTIELPVYNRVVASNYFSSMYNADIHRRFAEFSFSGAPVTIEITANIPFESVSVMPSRQQITPTVKGNVITYVVDEPKTTMLRLNDDKDTILTIFAEEPENPEDIPDKDDPNVIFFEAGYHEPEGGTISLLDGQTIYLAPGALVKARTIIRKAKNVTICGRGAFMEPSPTRMAVNEVRYMCQIEGSDHVKLQGVRFLDAHTFNITMLGATNIEIDSVKVLANQISTDGLSWWGRNENVYVHDSFWHISDDVFVVGGECNGTQLIENCIVGSDFGTFTFGNNTGAPMTFKNIDVFRSGRMFKCMAATTLGMSGATVTTENIYAEDVVTGGGSFMDLAGFCDTRRKFAIKNFSAPTYKRTQKLFQIDKDVVDTKITVENLWIGGKQFVSTTGWVMDKLKNGNEITFVETSDAEAAFVNKRILVSAAKYTPISVYIGDMRVESAAQPYIENDTVYVSVKEILEKLDFENIVLDGGNLTFSYKGEQYGLSADSTNAVADGKSVSLKAAPRLSNSTLFVPISVFEDLFGVSAKYDVGIKRVTIGNISRSGNLLRNSGIEEGLTVDWVTRSFTELYISEDAHSGKYAIRMYKDNDSYQNSDANGIYQDVIDVLRRYGAGEYRLTAYVKKTDNCTVDDIELGITRYFSPEKTSTRVKLTGQWQKIEYTYTFNGDMENLPAAYFYIGYSSGEIKNILVDDLCLEKIA